MTISKSQFHAYEAVRRSGVTNMFDLPEVCKLSGLTRDEVLFIMKHYGGLKPRCGSAHA